MNKEAALNNSSLFCSSLRSKDISASLSLKRMKQAQKKLKKRGKIGFSKPKQRSNTQRLSNEFKKIMEKHSDEKRVMFLKKNFSEYYGKNFASEYKKQYLFSQQWQQRVKRSEKTGHQDFNNLSKLEIVVIFLLMLVYIATLWYSNVSHFFSADSTSYAYLEVYIIAIIGIIGDTIFKSSREQSQKENLGFLRFVRKNCKELCCVLYLSLKASDWSCSSWWIFELVFSYFVCVRVGKLYEMVRFLKFRLYHTYQSKVMDLILTLLVILHIVAIVLFCATKAGYEKTWVSDIKQNITPLNQFTLYLYAFYFGTTTILTVGYGDITAKNPAEVGVVIVVEVIGILMFSYLINEIGYSISTLRKGREVVENDLAVLEKMRKHYHMKDQVSNQARDFLINHKPDSNLLQPASENALLLKFNEPLRNDIVASNNLAVVKSSLFFLTKWTNTFQRSIATKLMHRLFPPNDLIYQPLGNQRIYIFKTGRVSLFLHSHGRSNNSAHPVKLIDCKPDSQVAHNCYGFTAVISKRLSRLYAYSNHFTSSYFVDKQTFMNVVNEREQDFELYHQIWSKIDLQKFAEAFQAPLLQSSRHHYLPTISNIIKKHRRHTQMQNNSRNPLFQRSVARFKRTADYFQNDQNLQKIIRHRLDSKQPEKIQLQDSFSSNESELANFVRSASEKWQIIDAFERRKDFANYFKSHNFQQVLAKMELKSTDLGRKASTASTADKGEDQNCRVLPLLRFTLEKDRGISSLPAQQPFKY